MSDWKVKLIRSFDSLTFYVFFTLSVYVACFTAMRAIGDQVAIYERDRRIEMIHERAAYVGRQANILMTNHERRAFESWVTFHPYAVCDPGTYEYPTEHGTFLWNVNKSCD